MLNSSFLWILFLSVFASARGAETNLPLRVSTSPMPVSAPLILAQKLGWFTKAGLNVQLTEFSLGKLALEELSRGKLDLACAAVTPLVHLSMTSTEFRIISTVASSTGMVAMVARTNAGVRQLTDLAGKRIGVSKGTSGEFLFDTLRVLHRLPRNSVQVEDRSLDGMVSGIKDGSLDAAALWEPQISELDQALPGRLKFFYGNGLYTFTWNLVALPSTIQRRRSEMEKLLHVLTDVALFIERNPRAAQEQLRQCGPRGETDAKFLAQVRCRPVLSQDLLVQLEAEARWVMARDGKTAPLPNFLRVIDSSLLERMQPGAVSILK